LKLTDIIAIAALGLLGYAAYDQPVAPVVPVVQQVSTGTYMIDVPRLVALDQPDAALRKKDMAIWSAWYLAGSEQLKLNTASKFPQTTQNIADWVDRSMTLTLRNAMLTAKYPSLTEAVTREIAAILRDPSDPATVNPLQAVGKPLTDEKRLKLADLYAFLGQQTQGLSR
jgi:hypothetical protein